MRPTSFASTSWICVMKKKLRPLFLVSSRIVTRQTLYLFLPSRTGVWEIGMCAERVFVVVSRCAFEAQVGIAGG